MARKIPLTQGRHAMIDDRDFERVNRHRWHANEAKPGTFYAATYINGRRVYLHRYLLSLKGGERVVVDHANGDPLDNRRGNLRVCTFEQNAQNRRKQAGRATSRFKGVYRHGERWRAEIEANGQRVRLGTFDDEVEAALAYDAKAVELHGIYARTNFPAYVKVGRVSA